MGSTKSPVKMDRGSKKRSIFEEIQGPTESRFEAVNLQPKNHSKFPHFECPDFRRYVARDKRADGNKKYPTERKPMPDYNPSKEYTL